MSGTSVTYYYDNSVYTVGDNYCRDYHTSPTNVSTMYSPGAFFTAFASKSAVATKLNYAKSGLGISGVSAVYTDTYNPYTSQSTGGDEFRAIFTYSAYVGIKPYNEYSQVATPLSLYDICIRSTDSETYINSATYASSSWLTTTDTAHGRVIIGTAGNSNSIIVSDNSVDFNNHLLPLSDCLYNVGTASKKWKNLYVETIHADTYDGISIEAPDTSKLIYNNSAKLEATSNGVTSYGAIAPSSSSTYDLGASDSKWKDVYFTTIHAWGTAGNGGAIKLCDGNYENSSYCSITGYNDNSQKSTMTLDFKTSSTHYSIELAGPNTSTSGNETLTTIPMSSGTWSLGSSTFKLGDIYCTTIHADNYDGISGGGGSADTLTTARRIGVQNFNGSAAVNFCFSNTQSANTQSRTISASGYSLTEGVLIGVNFKYSHSGATTPTLNINSTGAYNLVDVSGENIKTWEDDTQMFLYYDSTFQGTSNNKKYVVIWRSDTGVISSSGTGQDVGNVTFGTSSVTMTKLGTDSTTSSSSITPYSSVSVSGTNITDSLMKTIAWRFGGGVASYNQSDSTGSNVGAIGLFALRRSSPTTAGSITSIHANNICAGSCLYQLEIHSTGLTSSTATSTSISLHVFNYWRSGTWLILTPYLNNFQGMSIVLATQILA